MVGVEFGGSGKPLMESNTSATAMISTASVKTDMLAVLDHDVLQDVSHIFAAIDCALEELVDFLELDQGNRLLLLVEQVHHAGSADQIRLVFQRIDFHPVLIDGAAPFPVFDCSRLGLRASLDDLYDV